MNVILKTQNNPRHVGMQLRSVYQFFLFLFLCRTNVFSSPRVSKQPQQEDRKSQIWF